LGFGLKALAGAFVTDPTAEDVDGFARFRGERLGRRGCQAPEGRSAINFSPGTTADILTILLPSGMPWHNVEATLQAAAPSARPGCADR
jgi:hypothetical protein